jgi:hypothetical protein
MMLIPPSAPEDNPHDAVLTGLGAQSCAGAGIIRLYW